METITTENKPDLRQVEAEFRQFVLDGQHPCVMAKSVFKMNHYRLRAYDDISSKDSHSRLLQDLADYLQTCDFSSTKFQTFVAIFPNDRFDDELSFEKALWNALQQLHNLDNADWDNTVSSDPDDAAFSFSLNGKAFYIIGMHPKSSRMARQAPYPAMVFNLHCQFENLRGLGTYHTVRDTIRKNDKKLQGSINPVLEDFGDDSESKQYSGRKVEDSWKCPFHAKHSHA